MPKTNKLSDSKLVEEIADMVTPTKNEKVLAPEMPETEEKVAETPTPESKASKGNNGKGKQSIPVIPNPILEPSTLKGKIDRMFTDKKLEEEKKLTNLANITLRRLCERVNDKEGIDLINLGEWYVVVTLTTPSTLGGNSPKDFSTKGFYCPSTYTGQWIIIDEDGVQRKGKELAISYWDLQDISADELFNFIVHETIHLYNDLKGTPDCSKNGTHKQLFVDTCAQTDWIEAVAVDGYVKYSSKISKKGQAKVKALKIKAPKVGKIRAPKKAKAKRVNLVCHQCDLKVMIPTGRYERGEADLDCLCLGSDNPVRMVAEIKNG